MDDPNGKQTSQSQGDFLLPFLGIRNIVIMPNKLAPFKSTVNHEFLEECTSIVSKSDENYAGLSSFQYFALMRVRLALDDHNPIGYNLEWSGR